LLGQASRAVFLSYASQDAEAARHICAALRAGGIEVWFDQSELRGGDVWDQKIRQQIHDCALFVPIISANTASRGEGYFRLEWGLADHRTHMMARNRTLIVPVCVDTTPDAGADVPESFLRVQWTRLPGGTPPRAFVERIATLLGTSVVNTPAPVERGMPVSPGLPSQVAAPPQGRVKNLVRRQLPGTRFGGRTASYQQQNDDRDSARRHGSHKRPPIVNTRGPTLDDGRGLVRSRDLFYCRGEG